MAFTNYSNSNDDKAAKVAPSKLNAANPIDDVVGATIETIARKGRGFTLGVVGEGDTTKVEVLESLPRRDEYRPLAEDRSHTLADSGSLVTYVKKYGTAEKSIVFVGEKNTVFVVDDSIERGKRETITLNWRASQDWKDWEALLSEPVGHKKLLKFLQQHEHNLVNPEMLVNLASISTTATVKRESDIQELGERVGVVLETTKGESLAKFPKRFDISVPVLDDDNDSGRFRNVTLNVEVIMPDEPMKPINFKLYTSRWQTTWRERITDEESNIRKELAGWLVVKGNAGYSEKRVG